MEQSTELSLISKEARQRSGPVLSLRTIREHEPYKLVVSRYHDGEEIERHVASIRQNQRTLVGLALDQEHRLLWPYPIFHALLQLADDEPELGMELLENAFSSARIVVVRDGDEAATLIRVAALGLSLPEGKSNHLIADEIHQELRWIERHRDEIDVRNPTYRGMAIRPSAGRIGKRLAVDNKRVERVYSDRLDLYGLRSHAGLPSLGSDLTVQKGRGARRGRRKKSPPAGPGSSPPREPLSVGGEPDNSGMLNLGDRPGDKVSERTGHWAVENMRRAMLGGKARPWRIPEVPFAGALDELPPTDPTHTLGGGGVGIAHLYYSARLLQKKAEGQTPPGWTKALDDYVEKVLSPFGAWLPAWDNEGRWQGRRRPNFRHFRTRLAGDSPRPTRPSAASP